MSDLHRSLGKLIPRGQGPWPQDNRSKTVSDWLADRLSDGGSCDREEASVSHLMLERVSGLGRGERISERWHASESQLEALSLMAERWRANEPLQHILNEAFFMGLSLCSDGRALIPRPETEELIHGMLGLTSNTDTKGSRFLDIGTGSGCIALAWNARRPMDCIVGLDASAAALEQAIVNSERVNSEGITWEHRNVLEDQESWPDDAFDVVISNPPYIPVSETNQMEERVIRKEPKEALFVTDEDPLLFYRRIVFLCVASDWLKSGGWLGFECHKNYAQEVCALLGSEDWQNVECRRDMQDHWRFVFARRR